MLIAHPHLHRIPNLMFVEFVWNRLTPNNILFSEIKNRYLILLDYLSRIELNEEELKH